MNDLAHEILIVLLSHTTVAVLLYETLKQKKIKKTTIEFICFAVINLILYFLLDESIFLWAELLLTIAYIPNLVRYILSKS